MIKTQSDLTQRNQPSAEGKGQGDLQPGRRPTTLPRGKENLVAKGNQDLRGTTRICALKTIDMTLEGRKRYKIIGNQHQTRSKKKNIYTKKV